MITMKENVIVIRHSRALCFNFDRPKYVDENFKHKIKSIIKNNESLAEDKIAKTLLHHYVLLILLKN